jgi:hypothetical protein
MPTFERVDWFNNPRLLEPIGNIPPAEAEARHYALLDETCMAAQLKPKDLRKKPGRFSRGGDVGQVLTLPHLFRITFFEALTHPPNDVLVSRNRLVPSRVAVSVQFPVVGKNPCLKDDLLAAAVG